MKTPRELLLTRHRNIEPRLEGLRREALRFADGSAQQTVQSARQGSGFLETCWRELFVSCRRYWFGLGTAWALVVLFGVAGAVGNGGAAMMTTQSDESRMQALHAQLELRDELLGAVIIEEPRADRPAPGPRSDVLREERHV